MSATSAASMSMTIGATWLPMRLALHGTLPHFDNYVARLWCVAVYPGPCEMLRGTDGLRPSCRYSAPGPD
jgi:hypothetical protein